MTTLEVTDASDIEYQHNYARLYVAERKEQLDLG